MRVLLPFFSFLFIANSYGQQWEWAYPVRSDNIVSIKKLETDSLGFAYLSGNNQTGPLYLEHSAGTSTIPVLTSFLAKYSSTGSLVASSGMWNNKTGVQFIVTDYSTDRSGNTYVTGTYRDSVYFGSNADTIKRTTLQGQYHSFLGKLDNSGKALWLKEEYDSCGIDGIHIQSCQNNEVVVIGAQNYICAVDTAWNGYIRKSNGGNGNTSWQMPGSFFHSLYYPNTHVAATRDGAFLVHGNYQYGATAFAGLSNTVMAPAALDKTDTYLVKYNLLGQVLWVNTIKGADYQFSGEVTVDNLNNIIFSIYSDDLCHYNTVPLLPLGKRTIHLIKCDQNGNYINHKSFNGEGWENFFLYDIKTDHLNNIFVTANMDTTFKIGNNTVYSYAGPNQVATAIIKFDPQLNYKWSEYMHGCCNFFAKVALHDSLIYVSGSHEGTVTLRNSPYTFSTNGPFKRSMFIACMKNDSPLTTFVNEHQISSTSLYPNPAITHVYASVENGSPVEILVMDTKGQILDSPYNLMPQGARIDLTNLKPGVYFVQINTKSSSYVQKLIVL